MKSKDTTPKMINKIKEIFNEGNIYPSGKLAALIKKHPDIIEYCEEVLRQEPAYEKISYVIICIVKRFTIDKM